MLPVPIDTLSPACGSSLGRGVKAGDLHWRAVVFVSPPMILCYYQREVEIYSLFTACIGSDVLAEKTKTKTQKSS